MDASTTVALFSALLVLAVVPGPSDVAVIARAVSAGFSQAAVMVAGIVVADGLLILIAVTSLAVLAEWVQGLTSALQWLGGAFLIGLGLNMFRTPQPADGIATPPRAGRASSFASGFLMTLADPKAVLFYMALLPAFADLGQLRLRDGVVILLAATAAICSVKLSYAWLAGRAAGMIENPTFRRNLNRGGGVVMLGIGAMLLVQAWMLR